MAGLGIADLLATEAGSAAQLAAQTGAHAPALYRVMRMLAGIGVFAESDDGTFSLTPLGDTLRTDVPLSESLDDLRWRGPDVPALTAFAQHWGDDAIVERATRFAAR